VINRSQFQGITTSRWSAAIALVAFALVIIGTNYVSAAPGQDARPRRSDQGVAPPTASPTPTRTTTSTTPAPRSPTPSTQGTPSTQTQVNRPTSQTTPPARPTPLVKTLPELGEPPPPPVLKPKPTPTPPEDYNEGEIIRVNTDLVTLNVRVIDRNNRPIDNVSNSEFHVYEDGIEQPIDSVSREEVPISYGLAIDNSQSLRNQLQSVIDAGKGIINTNKTGDETFLVRFISSDKIETLQDFTASKDLLIDAIDNMYVEGGQTAVIDAVYLASERVSEYKKGDDDDRRRRALIVVTDGEDRVSFYKQEQLFTNLRERDVQIYVIGFVNELDKEGGFIRKSPRDRAVNLLNKLASETGGRAFYPQSLSELPQIAAEIVRDLRTQYVVAYNPTNKTRDGSYRAIKVAIADSSSRDKRIALTRSGRLAPKGAAPATNPKTPAVKLPAGSKSATTNKNP